MHLRVKKKLTRNLKEQSLLLLKLYTYITLKITIKNILYIKKGNSVTFTLSKKLFFFYFQMALNVGL